MVHFSPALRPRRLASLFLAGVVAAAIVAPGAATATDPTPDAATLSASEAAMVVALNQDRTSHGLLPVRVDVRLMAIARARSNDMVANHYFGHVQPDGRNVFDIINAAHITWYGAGEIIAWNNYSMDVTVSAANHQWLGSPGHYAILMSSDYNYVGVGLAFDPATGQKFWTADYLKGPDRTAARASVSTPTVAAGTTSATRRVHLAWTGYDPRLQVLTSGLRAYGLQRSVDGGIWTTIYFATTLKSATLNLALGHLYQFRVVARDRAGNHGTWVIRTVDLR